MYLSFRFLNSLLTFLDIEDVLPVIDMKVLEEIQKVGDILAVGEEMSNNEVTGI